VDFALPIIEEKTINSVIEVPKSGNLNPGKSRNDSEEDALLKLIKFQIYLLILGLTRKVRQKLN
jgi:hypothetical protein